MGALAWRDFTRPRLELPPLEPLSAKDAARLEHLRSRLATRPAAFRPCLSDPEIEAFEATHGVRLPPQYRAFLATIGNGGEGPAHYGVHELAETARLAEPFDLSRAVRSDAGGKGERGRLSLGTDGCNIQYYLIITGKARGQVWRREDGSFTPVGKPRCDFFGWYEGWLRQ